MIHQSDILARYGDSLKALLIDTFPEIFGKTKGNAKPPSLLLSSHTKEGIERESYWEDRQNRKRFLTALSSKLGFDPLVIENWHEKTTQLRAYGVSVRTFSLLLFPFLIISSGRTVVSQIWRRAIAAFGYFP